jgi:triacylglycerol esterase/lipase EstA (alpha/beta hydrolase family)
MRSRHALPALAALIALAAPGVAAAKRDGPALATPVPALRAALDCNGPLTGTIRRPVLLVHGTFADSEINWSWNYARALPARGQPACWVDLPDKAAGDAQVSTEYVVWAIRSMARRSGHRVALVTHSQGGLEARWALRWWPDVRRLVSDLVLLAPPNYGAVFTDRNCSMPSTCAAALYQMRSDSKFLAALNAGRHAYGRVAITSIPTEDDSVFVLPEQAELGGESGLISNISVQDLCPGHMAQHNDLPFDGPAWAIALDALDHRGPAELNRIDPDACALDTVPGVNRADAEARLAAYTATLVELLGPTGPKAEGEPPLAPYVR